jgi:aryl-alcohol dehydrogenase-like predicted oxidoreductase
MQKRKLGRSGLEVSAIGPGCMGLSYGLVDVLKQTAAARQATPAQIALAWAAGAKSWIAPIPGTTKLHRLKENIGGASIELPGDLRRMCRRKRLGIDKRTN